MGKFTHPINHEMDWDKAREATGNLDDWMKMDQSSGGGISRNQMNEAVKTSKDIQPGLKPDTTENW